MIETPDNNDNDDDKIERGLSGVLSQMITNPCDAIVPLLIRRVLCLVGHDHEEHVDH